MWQHDDDLQGLSRFQDLHTFRAGCRVQRWVVQRMIGPPPQHPGHFVQYDMLYRMKLRSHAVHIIGLLVDSVFMLAAKVR
jgi:hypothetical protein